MANHGVDGDISDGISVISDCDSINDRHSPMPIKMTSATTTLHADDYPDETDRNKTTNIEDIQNYLLVERSTENQVQAFRSDVDSPRNHLWNPSNIILFGLIIGAAAILSSQCWKINSSHDSIIPEMSLLAQRIQDLESENFALKVEVNRLVELHHAGHDEHFHSYEKATEKPQKIKQKKVWTGADDGPIHIPKVPIKENYCNDEYLNSDDLFASYNYKKCESNDNSKKQRTDTDKSEDGSDDDVRRQMASDTNSSQQFDSRRKKNCTKGESASVKREKFAESKIQNAENQRPDSEADDNVRNEKYVKFQEERQKLFDEATQKYFERQKKLEKKQENDRKNRAEDVLKESKNDGRKQPKETDSEWYDKMMKQREELRASGDNSGATKQKNKENWYMKRANEREKVRGKNEKRTKSKP